MPCFISTGTASWLGVSWYTRCNARRPCAAAAGSASPANTSGRSARNDSTGTSPRRKPAPIAVRSAAAVCPPASPTPNTEPSVSASN
jgi:hypothetical protein